MNEIVKYLDENKSSIDIDYWLAQWESMQDAYVPYRNERFDFINDLVKYLFTDRADIRILDIGCGTLSFSSKFLNYSENIKIVGVDYHPLLYWLSCQKYMDNEIVELMLLDIRKDHEWEKINEKNFDLIVSSTALHWLGKNNLVKVLNKSFSLLSAGGYFINIDHMRNGNNDIQNFVENERKKIYEKEFKDNNIKNWDRYFNDFSALINKPDLQDEINRKFGKWEGIEEGLTFKEYREIMEKIGFNDIDTIWQYLNDRIIIAKKKV
ncbi:MAG: class I SAM-dependent methyltransferase [Spirochaetes bacterium]|nr:class I SAM-dependent methyltransferase [Spirochaetota bacterium]